MKSNWKKLLLIFCLFFGYAVVSNFYFLNRQEKNAEIALENFKNRKVSTRENAYVESSVYILGWVCVATISGLVIFKK